jgi:NADH dehydrogenase FAD-containing subunit
VSTHVVILGAGFGGLELSSRLSAELADEVHVTLIDQSDSFIFVVESGLTEDGWIPVDPATFATRFPDVYAVGDVTSAPVPRAGVIAEGEAATVADVLIARITGGPPPAPYPGEMTCYIEMGEDTVGTVDANFLSGPAPTALFTPPSLEGAEDKRRFAAFRRDRWFGPGSGESLPDGTTPDSPSPHEESHDHHLA